MSWIISSSLQAVSVRALVSMTMGSLVKLLQLLELRSLDLLVGADEVERAGTEK